MNTWEFLLSVGAEPEAIRTIMEQIKGSGKPLLGGKDAVSRVPMQKTRGVFGSAVSKPRVSSKLSYMPPGR